MSLEIEKLELSIDVYEAQKVSDDIILKLLDSYTSEDKIFRILLNICSIQVKQEISFNVYRDYFYDFVDRVIKLSNIQCDEKETTLYKIFVISSLNFRNLNDDELNNLIALYKTIDNDVYEKDYMKYMQYRIRHILLLIYVSDMSKHITEAKELLSRIKNSDVKDIPSN